MVSAGVVNLLLAGIAAFVLFAHRREIQQALMNFMSNFPRGGQPPTHPSPAADDAILARRRRSQPRDK